MPTYLYKCKTCGKEFNYSQKITEDALINCPEDICDSEIKGKGEVIRKISKNVGLIFNGSGFYLTDYGRKNSSAPSPSTSTESSSCACSDGSCKVA
jgi:putative FmdB family regulatory protein